MAVYLKDKRVYLRTLKRSDLNELDTLMDDRNIQVLTGSVYPNTQKGMEDFIEKCQIIGSRIWFAIIDNESNKLIGETGFLRIFMPWRTSDFTLEIWNKNYWNKGYGKETAHLMLDYGFNFLNFHRIAIGVVEKNTRAMKFWQSIGFKEEGRQIEGFYSEGEYSDFIMMYLLEDDYRKGLNKRPFSENSFVKK